MTAEDNPMNLSPEVLEYINQEMSVPTRKLAWATMFLKESESAQKLDDKQRYLVAAIDCAVGIVECIVTERSETDMGKKGSVHVAATKTLPRFDLMRKMRVHNFHRRPVPVMTAAVKAAISVVSFQGPVQVKANSKPESLMAIVRRTQTQSPTGKATALMFQDDMVFDEVNNDLVVPADALKVFLAAVPEFLTAIGYAESKPTENDR